MPTTATEPSRREIWKMFDRIAPRYDLLNRVLSFRQDVAWRRQMARYLPDRKNLALLDLATGTGDQILFLLERTKIISRALGLDMSEGMLEAGRQKIRQRGLAQQVELRAGDAMQVPVEAGSVDVITMSFGIRNVLDVVEAMRNMHRALRPGGRLLILEFSRPTFPPLRPFYFVYLRYIVPWVGGLLSGDPGAYRYLNQTIETFPSGPAFCALMREAGFASAQAHPLTGGIATIYQADKT